MKDEFSRNFQVAVVFIGTIVGAGLASGQEIKEFFTSYGVIKFLRNYSLWYILCCSRLYSFQNQY